MKRTTSPMYKKAYETPDTTIEDVTRICTLADV